MSIPGHQKVVAEQRDGKSPSNDAGPAQSSICMVCVEMSEQVSFFRLDSNFSSDFSFLRTSHSLSIR